MIPTQYHPLLPPIPGTVGGGGYREMLSSIANQNKMQDSFQYVDSEILKAYAHFANPSAMAMLHQAHLMDQNTYDAQMHYNVHSMYLPQSLSSGIEEPTASRKKAGLSSSSSDDSCNMMKKKKQKLTDKNVPSVSTDNVNAEDAATAASSLLRLCEDRAIATTGNYRGKWFELNPIIRFLKAIKMHQEQSE